MGQQPLLGAARPGHAAAVPGGLCVCVFRGRVVGSTEGAGLRHGSPRGEAGRGAPPGGRAGGFWAGPARPCRPPPPHPTPFTPPAAPGPCCLSWGCFSRGSFSALPVAAVPCRPGAVPPTLRRLAFQEQDKQGARGGAPPPPVFCWAGERGDVGGCSAPPPPVLFLEMISYLCGGAAGFGPGLPLRAPLSVTLSSAMKTIVPLSQLPVSSFPSPWHLGVLRGQLCRALQPLGTPNPSPVGVGLLGSIPSCPWGVPVPLCHHLQQPRVPAHLNQPFMGALGLRGAAVPWL